MTRSLHRGGQQRLEALSLLFGSHVPGKRDFLIIQQRLNQDKSFTGISVSICFEYLGTLNWKFGNRFFYETNLLVQKLTIVFL